ncbi:MAG: acyl-ACP--UDP-N-acetylglucosamine O-acyltransferase [Acidobacteria bacterium]|nr:acyl-ACP--UDP-N-acetylglucosamine O-acyltransferase [Acidobacteriota bacterium]
MMEIHDTAIVSPRAELAPGVKIGPYCVIGEEVYIGENSFIGPHTVIRGLARIGKRNRVLGQSAIGTDPQDLKFRGERSCLEIGDENIIREFVTINRGTAGGGGRTVIGSGNLMMTGVHIAHDCIIGDDVILANAATLAGHVLVGSHSTIGAFSGVHQFCRVGDYAFVGGYSVITRDALPFVKTVGTRNEARIYGINSIGLERKGFSPERIVILKKAYRWLFQKGLKVADAVLEIREEGLASEEVQFLIRFIEEASRGFVR